MKKTLFYTAAAATALLMTTACGSDTTAATAADDITVSSAWAKAAESGMTGAFAELENTGDTDVRIVGASSPSATRTELHEMAGAAGAMVMREMEDGFTVPSGATHSLAPGSDHLMLMDLVEPVTPGSEVIFTLTFDDGSTKEFTAQVRDFAGAQENYESSPGGMNHDG